MNDGVGDHRDHGHFVEPRRAFGPKRAEGLEDVRHLDAAFQRPVIARGDHRAVRDRVRIGDPHFDQMRPRLTSSLMSIPVVERSGSPAVTNGMNARRFSFRNREKRLSMRFMVQYAVVSPREKREIVPGSGTPGTLTPDGLLGNRLPPESSDFVGVLIASAGETND